MSDMSGSKRFLDAYNKTDKALHSRFGLKPSMSFTDAVRRAASLNSVVRRFEQELIDYGRLRNAIVHNSDSTRTIAEPHDDVTESFERIASILADPPKASAIAHEPSTVAPSTPLADAIAVMGGKDYSIVPVVDKSGVVGVFTNKNIAEFIARNLDGLEHAVKTATVGDVMSGGDSYYGIMRDAGVDEILLAFEKNRKLRMVIITDNGLSNGRITGIITVSDLATVTKMLDSY